MPFSSKTRYQGKGIGTILLERLALAADLAGYRRLIAQVLPENQQMLTVFQDSGYDFDRASWTRGSSRSPSISSRPSAASAMAEARDRIATQASLEPFFRPRSVAVIGASRTPGSIGYRVLQNLITTGFNGPVYPVNPKANVVSSIPAYPSVKDIPGPVDLAIIAVPQPARSLGRRRLRRKGRAGSGRAHGRLCRDRTRRAKSCKTGSCAK